MLEINECAAATGEDAIYPGASALRAGHSFSDLDGKHNNGTDVHDTGNIDDSASAGGSDGEGCDHEDDSENDSARDKVSFFCCSGFNDARKLTENSRIKVTVEFLHRRLVPNVSVFQRLLPQTSKILRREVTKPVKALDLRNELNSQLQTQFLASKSQ